MLNKNDTSSSNQKWTRKTLKAYVKEHPEIHSRSSLEKSSQSAYKAAKRLNLLDTLFAERLKERDVYSPQIVIDYIKSHPNIKSRNDLKNSSEPIYNAAYRFKMMNMLFGDSGYKQYTKEEIVTIIQYNNIKNGAELKKFSESIYKAAKRFNLLEELFNENTDNIDHNFKGYCVYVYKVLSLHSIYVGLTIDPIQRDHQHITPNSKGEYDTLGTYCKKHNVPIPKMEIVKDELTSSEASKYEKQLWYEYKDSGWDMINSEKSLGNLGALKHNWTKRKIKNYIKSHKEIKSPKDLKKYNPTAYQIALKNDFLNELFKKQITEKDVRDFINKHPEIKSKTALRKLNKDIFNAAKKLDLLDKFFKTRIRKYTIEYIFRFISEHPEIKSKKDFYNINSSAYSAALSLGIIKILFPKNQKRSKWNEETIKKFLKEHPEIKTRKQLQKVSQSIYNAARVLNLLEQLFGSKRTKTKYTEKLIRQYLSEHPDIKKRKQFQKMFPGMYLAANRLKLLDELFGPKIPKWTEETIRKFLREHPDIKKRRQLFELYPNVYVAANRLKLLDELFGPKISKWTEETIRKFLKEHPEIKTKSDFARIKASAYQKALKLKIINDLFK